MPKKGSTASQRPARWGAVSTGPLDDRDSDEIFRTLLCVGSHMKLQAGPGEFQCHEATSALTLFRQACMADVESGGTYE